MSSVVRVAVVTGASRGIGEATARRLAHDGFTVVLAARRAETLEAVATAIRDDAGTALIVPADLGDLDSIDALVDNVVGRLGRIDVVINNAGILPAAARAETLSRQDWQTALDVNLTGPVHLARSAKPHMTSGSVVVNVSSTAAYFPSTGLVHYNTSKAALIMATRTLALEWAREGIRVVGVAPGKVDTALVEPILEWTRNRNLPLNPLGRIGAPEEVADLISFLVSERAGYLTGTTVVIDGGELLTSGR